MYAPTCDTVHALGSIRSGLTRQFTRDRMGMCLSGYLGVLRVCARVCAAFVRTFVRACVQASTCQPWEGAPGCANAPRHCQQRLGGAQ